MRLRHLPTKKQSKKMLKIVIGFQHTSIGAINRLPIGYGSNLSRRKRLEKLRIRESLS